MHIMTDRGWVPLAAKSIPAPRDRSMLEDFKWWFPGIQPGDIAAKYIASIDARNAR